MKLNIETTLVVNPTTATVLQRSRFFSNVCTSVTYSCKDVSAFCKERVKSATDSFNALFCVCSSVKIVSNLASSASVISSAGRIALERKNTNKKQGADNGHRY